MIFQTIFITFNNQLEIMFQYYRIVFLDCVNAKMNVRVNALNETNLSIHVVFLLYINLDYN